MYAEYELANGGYRMQNMYLHEGIQSDIGLLYSAMHMQLPDCDIRC